MPVRSLHSAVMKWPTRKTVDAAVRTWAHEHAARHPGLVRLGYFGSYATGTWGVGSDLDLVIVLEHCDTPFSRRAEAFDVSALPVPTDVLVYSRDELAQLPQQSPRFARELGDRAVWVFP